MKIACESCEGRGWRWAPGTGPSCTHTQHQDVCDSCADFLVRFLAIVARHADRKPRQEDIALHLGYTTRHLRRIGTYFGFRTWSAFWVAARDGLLHEQHDDAGNALIVPFRRPA